MVIQQLEGLTTEIEAIRGFLEVLDEDYVGAEPAGDRSIRSIFHQIMQSDLSLHRIANSDYKPDNIDKDLDFPALLSAVQENRQELVEELKQVDHPETEVVIDGEKTSLVELAKLVAVANAGDFREIAYRLHGSQKIFKA